MMTVELFGYSERGMINSLCDDLHYAKDPLKAVSSFLSWFTFAGQKSPPCFSNIKNAKLIVEQSFSDFGDADLLILLKDYDEKPQVVFVEAKVSTDTNSWKSIGNRWIEFETMIDGAEQNTSNLFVQLHRKVRLTESLLYNDREFETDIFTPRGSCGRNQVVSRAMDTLKEFINQGKVWYCAIVPDDLTALESFADETLHQESIKTKLTKWDTRHFGLLSWQTINEKTTSEWPRTQANFRWNDGQIFRKASSIPNKVDVGQVYLDESGKRVFVVAKGRGLECRVVDLVDMVDSFFWRSRTTNVEGLIQCELPVIASVLPSIPRAGKTYTWNCQTDPDRMPPSSVKIVLRPGTRVTVVKPSWFTTRVRIADSPEDATSFPVFTHHLQCL